MVPVSFLVVRALWERLRVMPCPQRTPEEIRAEILATENEAEERLDGLRQGGKA